MIVSSFPPQAGRFAGWPTARCTHTCVVRFEFRYYFWTYRALGITLTKCLDQVVPIPNPSIDHESSVFIAVFEPQSLHVVFRFHPIPLLHQLSVCWDIQNSSAFGWHAQLRCFADMVNVSEGERGAWCGLGFQLSHQSWVNHGSVTFIYTFPFYGAKNWNLYQHPARFHSHHTGVAARTYRSPSTFRIPPGGLHQLICPNMSQLDAEQSWYTHTYIYI